MHDEILVKNHQQHPVGAAPLPEVYANAQNNRKFNGQDKGPAKNFKGKRSKKGKKRSRGKKGPFNKGKAFPIAPKTRKSAKSAVAIITLLGDAGPQAT